MELVGRRVGIVGAGVGGLSAALALAQRGADVQIFERARQRRREGIALLVWGWHAHESLASEASEVVHGAPSNKSIVLMVIGGVAVAAGAVGLIRRGN